MSNDTIAIGGFVLLFVLMLLRVPVGIAMGLVGIVGFGFVTSDVDAALALLAQSPIRDTIFLYLQRPNPCCATPSK